MQSLSESQSACSQVGRQQKLSAMVTAQEYSFSSWTPEASDLTIWGTTSKMQNNEYNTMPQTHSFIWCDTGLRPREYILASTSC